MELGDFAAGFGAAGLLKTRTYVDALREMEYDVVGVGERELAGGLDRFDEILGAAPFTLTTATFTKRGGAETIAEPYLIREYTLPEKGKIKIGFVSLSAHNNRIVGTGREGETVVSNDPVEQARQYLPRVAEETDLVVLMAKLTPSDLRRVAEAVPGTIDLAIASFAGRISPNRLERIGGVPTLYAGDQGKRLGEVRLYLEGGEVNEMKAFLVSLTQRYPEEPGLRKVVNRMLAEVNSLMKAKAARRARAPSSGAPAPSPKVAEGRYLTAQACASCHETAYRIWQESSHARAMRTLAEANQASNLECVRCHATGFGTPLGFQSARVSRQLANVQCEACHGSAALHVRDTSKPYGSVPPRACYTCHTKENSAEFSFFKYWQAIKH